MGADLSQNPAMRVSARVDYALRAATELAAAPAAVKGERIARLQGIPAKFLENILGELGHAGIVRAQRGPEGGYRLARPPEEITLAAIIRAVGGPLANVRGERPEALQLQGPAGPLREVWVAARASLRTVLESVTLADVASGTLPDAVTRLASDPEAWRPH
jgi:Rrf2 family protein